MPAAAACASFLRDIKPPRIPSRAAAHQRMVSLRSGVAERRQRRLWVLIPFGFEYETLLLQMLTLTEVVDGFLISEATDVHTGNQDKPAILQAKLAAGEVPARLARKLTVAVSNLATDARCLPRVKRDRVNYDRTECYEQWQRYVLLGMLFRVASPSDVAIVADADEIARPETVRLLRECYPFGTKESRVTTQTRYIEPSMVALYGIAYAHGVHCPTRETWTAGPRAFGVGHLLERYANPAAEGAAAPNASRLAQDSRDFTFTRAGSEFSTAVLQRVAWHLTSVGDGAALRRKLTTWLHAGRYVNAAGAQLVLEPTRLERCARYCLSTRGTAPCAGRDDGASEKLRGSWVPRLRDVARQDLPAPLLRADARSRFPAMLYYVDNTTAAWGVKRLVGF